MATYNPIVQEHEGDLSVLSGNQYQLQVAKSVSPPRDSIGEWVVNDNNPYADANSLNVGSNGYSMPVNVVVGIRDPSTGQWQLIFIDPDQLAIKAHGEYESRESIHFWYQDGTLTSTMISIQSTPVETFDMTGLNQHCFMYITATSI